MVFSSHIFIFYFLPVVLGIYYAMLAARTSITARHLFLTCAGMVFYGWWNPWFVLLMLGTTALDYNLGRMTIEHPTDTEVFRTYVAEVLCPTLHKGDIVIMKA